MERAARMTGSDEQSERTRTADGTSFPSPRPRGAAPADPPPARPLDPRHELISSLARTVTGRLDLADVLAATLSELRTLIAFTGGSIQLVDDEGWIRLPAAGAPRARHRHDAR